MTCLIIQDEDDMVQVSQTSISTDFYLVAFLLDAKEKSPIGGVFSTGDLKKITENKNKELKLVKIRAGEFRNLLTKVPTGSFNSDGSIKLCPIPKSVFDELLAVEKGKTSEVNESTDGIAKETFSKSDSSLPIRFWSELKENHIVLVQDVSEEGWWEARILKVEGNRYTVRYCDYPDEPILIRSIKQIAILHPEVLDARKREN
jgi:hypothetical protein